MSHAVEVERATDDKIWVKGENVNGIYIGLGQKITVKWMPRFKLYWCATCNANACEHVDRVAKWREGNL